MAVRICRAAASELRLETSSAWRSSIQERVAVTATKVMAETIRVAVKMKRFKVMDVKAINLLRRDI
jgi:hypothetical protein